MTAQSEHPADPRAHAIPHTINAIGEALTGAKRAQFYAEVLAAEEGDAINSALRKWWMVAMLDAAPGADHSRANAAAGRRLVAVADLADRLAG